MSSLAGRLGIERLLKWAPHGTVNTNEVDLVDDWDSVLAAVARGAKKASDRYDILIAEFRLPGSCSFADIHAADSTFSVIDVDLLRGTSNTPMFDVGSERLLRLAEWLTREAGLSAPPAASAALDEMFGREDDERGPSEPPADPQPDSEPAAAPPPALAGPDEPLAIEPPPLPRLVPPAAPPAPARGADDQLVDLARWLDLRLGLVLARTERQSPGQDIPGWTMSAERARSLLGADIARLPPDDLQREWTEADRILRSHVEAAARGSDDTTLGSVCHAFALDPIDRQILYWALAPDLAGRFAQAIGFLNDQMTQCHPTASLLAELIDGAGPPWQVHQRLSGETMLARFRLVRTAWLEPLVPHSLAPVVAAPDLVTILLGGRAGEGLEGVTSFAPADHAGSAFDLQVAPVLRAARGAAGEAKPIVRFHAPAADSSWLAAQLASCRERALVGDLAPLAGAGLADVNERLLVFARAARAADAALIVSGLDDHGETVRSEVARTLAVRLAPHLRLVVVQGKRIAPTHLREASAGVLEISRPRPTREERAAIWLQAAESRGIALAGDGAREMAATFAFDRSQAEAAIALALGSGAAEPPEAGPDALRDAARTVSWASAPAAVRRIETGLGWDDLVLPARIKSELQGVAVHIRHAAMVWEEWGFGERIPYGQATIALLTGPSGTGKTMAARIIAAELGAALFQIDLAQTVSKYIGETEKILDAAFDAAEAAGALMLFDEADALFGKRSEIHDAHDKYANTEVSHLLQRVEEYPGPIILTTNRKSNLDPAFLRRLSKVIDFPMPDEEQRGLIWKRLMPEDAPFATDVDPSAFRQLPLSGGAIANSILAAAFMAAEDGGSIQMRHLVAGARAELAKSGMESAGRILTRLIGDERSAGAEP